MRIFYLQVLLLLISFFSPIAQATEDRVYTFGVVPQFNAHKLRKIWDPILREVEKKTGLHFKLIGSPSIPVFELEVFSGRFDFCYTNPYHMVMANKAQGYLPLVHDHGRKLHGILVVNRNGPIRKISDLEGKKIAFPSPNALGASLLIRYDLVNRFKLNFKPVYVNTHSSVYLNVALQQTAAGGGVQKTLLQQKPAIQNVLKVIHRTQNVTSHPVAAHPRVPAKVRTKVRQAFLQIAQTEKGRALLARIPMQQIGISSMQDYEELRKLKLEKFIYDNQP